MFKYKLNCPEAKKPEKKRASDAGYDLHLIRLLKIENGIYYYDTGVSVQLPDGFYGLLVGRSSIAKSGYTLANGIGVIDNEYRGSIIVALTKQRQDAPPLELPAKLVQYIPVKQYFMAMPYEVTELDSTDRQDTGGLGSRQFVTST